MHSFHTSPSASQRLLRRAPCLSSSQPRPACLTLPTTTTRLLRKDPYARSRPLAAGAAGAGTLRKPSRNPRPPVSTLVSFSPPVPPVLLPHSLPPAPWTCNLEDLPAELRDGVRITAAPKCVAAHVPGSVHRIQQALPSSKELPVGAANVHKFTQKVLKKNGSWVEFSEMRQWVADHMESVLPVNRITSNCSFKLYKESAELDLHKDWNHARNPTTRVITCAHATASPGTVAFMVFEDTHTGKRYRFQIPLDGRSIVMSKAASRGRFRHSIQILSDSPGKQWDILAMIQDFTTDPKPVPKRRGRPPRSESAP